MCLTINYKFTFLLVLALGFTLSSCNKDDDDDMTPMDDTEFNTGGFVINKGLANGTGTVSFYNPSTDYVTDSIFIKANPGMELGAGLIDIDFAGDFAYLLMEGKEEILVVNGTTFKFVGVISGFLQPKELLVINNDKAYVSQWGTDGDEGSIKVVNLGANSIINTIPTAKGPSAMLKRGKDVYVTNTGGIFVDSIVTKINTETDAISTTIEVGKVPNSLTLDRNGALWVISQGVLVTPGNPGNPDNINGALVKIENDVPTLSIDVSPSSAKLTINQANDKLFFETNGWVYAHDITSTTLPLIPFIDKSFAGFDVNKTTGDLYAADAGNFNSKGRFVIYDADTGLEKTAYDAGVIPIGFTFK